MASLSESCAVSVPAVVTPLDEHMGLDIARSLGRRRIPVYGIDPDPKAIGGKSKYCRLVVCPDPKEAGEDYIQFLVDWGKRLENRAVLYPLSDDVVLLCSRERQALQPYYEFVMPDHSTIVQLLTKEGLDAVARACGIPAPWTVIPKDEREVEAIAQSITYPVILKPVESAYWHAPEIASMLRQSVLSGRAKVVLCGSAAELVRAYRNIAAIDNRMIIQEVIPGPAENGVYITFYLDRQSNPQGIFAGRKLRVLPMGFGSSCYVRSCYAPDVERVALRLLSCVRYQGLGGMEFKKDPRDGCYKLIEFNTRYGMWDGLGIRCGVDSPYLAYRDALNLPVEPQLTYREGVIWFDWQRDVRAFWMHHKEGQLALGQWLRSLRGEKMWAIYSRDDWRPGAAFTINMLQILWTRIISRRA